MLTDSQWVALRDAVDQVINRELDYTTVGEDPVRGPVRVARGYCSGPFSRHGITIILEPERGWDLEPQADMDSRS